MLVDLTSLAVSEADTRIFALDLMRPNPGGISSLVQTRMPVDVHSGRTGILMVVQIRVGGTLILFRETGHGYPDYPTVVCSSYLRPARRAP
jgi:hypothetical protein